MLMNIYALLHLPNVLCVATARAGKEPNSLKALVQQLFKQLSSSHSCSRESVNRSHHRRSTC
jgi:uncharacterized membrane protein YccC